MFTANSGSGKGLGSMLSASPSTAMHCFARVLQEGPASGRPLADQ